MTWCRVHVGKCLHDAENYISAQNMVADCKCVLLNSHCVCMALQAALTTRAILSKEQTPDYNAGSSCGLERKVLQEEGVIMRKLPTTTHGQW